MDTQFIKAKHCVLQELVKHDWQKVDALSMECTTIVAEKQYLTAVGNKRAAAYVFKAEGSYYITANYESEGNNVLSTTYVVVTDLTNLAFELAEFARQVDLIVSKTYAMRLVINSQRLVS